LHYITFLADPHPGNVMVQAADGRPVLIDWGQCMELTRQQRQTLCELTLLLRTRCLPLIGAALQTQGLLT
jgi:predicted unusual protein kinase regulating ubiquinone biosynthesis (AarF/ABC1/UbiB family)